MGLGRGEGEGRVFMREWPLLGGGGGGGGGGGIMDKRQ